MRLSLRRGSVAAAIVLAIASLSAGVGAHASLTDDSFVSDNPANYTPNVNQGAVTSLAKVGNTMVAVGKFTTVTDFHGTTFNRTNIFAFDANTGEISTSFVPQVNGTASRVIDSGDGTSVYVVGAFSQVNSTPASHAARITVSNGALVTSFKAAASNGVINDAVLRDDKLYVGGAFKKMGGHDRTLLAALNASTGADTGAVASTLTDVFNGGSTTVKALDVSQDDSRMVAIGNFRTVDGATRTQIAMWDTTVSPAVLTSWSTDGYNHPCAANAFDTYMRDVSITPDGSYFAVATTGAFDGGVNNNSLCDTITRWEMGASGSGQTPSWVDYSGGDTFYAVTAIGKIIYIGGHQRWVNNPYAGDAPGPGAVSREGMAVFDARNGLPFSWNPGRARGVGLREFLAVDNGIWVAHDTNRLGHEQRKRIAFLPIAGGTPLPSENTGTLPSDVFTAGSTGSTANAHWLARVNTGGSLLVASDNGPDWATDTDASPSPLRNGNSNAADWADLPFTRNASLPGYAPTALFSTERWSPSDTPNMQWNIPAPVGDNLTVNLFFANGCSCTENVGQRRFDVFVDGTKVLDNFDIVAAYGDQTGGMKSFSVPSSDGNVDIDFGHRTENPLINGIEVIDNSVAAPPPSTGNEVVRHPMSTSGSTGAPSTLPSSTNPWSQARGAFMVDGSVYYGKADGTFHRVPFNGTTFGTDTTINLNQASGQNHRFVSDLPNITGMFYDRASARLYYTLSGQNTLYYRYFEPESNIVGAVRLTGPAAPAGLSWGNVSGMFLANGSLYVGDRTTGNLSSVAWSNGAPSGSVSAVSTPGHDWRARATFVMAP
jgi:hypothetical protein